MAFGAATVAAERYGVGEVIDPCPHAIGSIARAYEAYPHIGAVLPALGYSDDQRRELKATIEAWPMFSHGQLMEIRIFP